MESVLTGGKCIHIANTGVMCMYECVCTCVHFRQKEAAAPCESGKPVSGLETDMCAPSAHSPAATCCLCSSEGGGVLLPARAQVLLRQRPGTDALERGVHRGEGRTRSPASNTAHTCYSESNVDLSVF